MILESSFQFTVNIFIVLLYITNTIILTSVIVAPTREADEINLRISDISKFLML